MAGLRSPLGLSLVLAAAAVLATGAGAYWNTQGVARATARVAHTHQVQAALEEVLSVLKDVETGQRGYLLTGQEPYLQPYLEASAQLEARIASAQALTADNLLQQERVATLRTLAARRVAVSQEAVRRRRSGDIDGALQVVNSGRGKQVMDAARAELALMKAEEQRLLALRMAEVKAASRRSATFAVLTTGLVLALLATAFVTARRAGRKVRASERSLRSSLVAAEQSNRELAFQKYALDQAAVVAVTDAQGTITYVNDKFCEVSGYGRDELLGRNHRLVNSGAHPGRFFDDLYATIAEGRTWHGEIHNRRKDGSLYWMDTTIVPLLDAHGLPERYVSIRYEITERKEAEDALRRSQALTQAIIEGANALVYAKDLQGRYFLTNRAWRSLVHLTPEEAEGTDDVHVFGPVVAQRLREIDRQVLESGETVVTEEVVVIAGRSRTYLTSKFPLREADGTLYAVCGVSAEVTELKAAQREVQRLNTQLEQRVAERTRQLSEANQELEAFSYTVSHDLRAPLRGLQGFAQAVHEDYGERLDPEGRDYLDRIIAAARRMEGLIQDLLDYGRLAREELRLRPVHLSTAVAEALGQLASEIERRHAVVSVQEPLRAVMAHPAVLMQVLANLVGNAVKFVAPGAVPRVRIRAERLGDGVRTWVEDQGIGVRPEHQERIFHVFERLHGQESYPGTGVGLAIVRKGCERMGGRCGVLSAPGGGSRFWFELTAAPGGAA